MPTDVLSALYEGRLAEAEQLAAGRNLNVFEAAALGRLDRLRELLADHPDAAAETADDGFTALHLAAFFGAADAVVLLLRAGANPDAVAENDMRVRPLHSAVATQRLDIARCLLACGASTGGRQHGGWTPLMAAAKHGNEPLVELLLACGADRATAADDGSTAADLAAAHGRGALAARVAP